MYGQSAMTCMDVLSGEIPDDVILTPPKGEIKQYYMDYQTHDPVAGFIMSYHNLKKVTFCDNGEVYLPNIVREKTFKSYMKGELNKKDKTISFPSKLIVGWGPNEKKYYYLRPCDKSGKLKNVDNFKFMIDDKTGVIRCEDDLYLALYFGEDIEGYYDIAGEYVYHPKEEIDAKLDSYNMSCTKSYEQDKVLKSKVKGYFDKDRFFVKGLNEKFPQAWMMGTKKDGKIQFMSRQMSYILYNDDPIVMFAMKDEGEDRYTPLNGFELNYDEKNNVISGLDHNAKIVMANVLFNEDETYEVNQTYDNFKLELTPLTPAIPANPKFNNFSLEEKEFTFTLPSTDKEGVNNLDTDYMTFKVFMDDKPYTFTKAAYPKLKEDVTDIPFDLNVYGVIMASKFKRYIYFNEIPKDVKTLAVEVTYIVKGTCKRSKRLVYNISTGEQNYVDPSPTNIETLLTENDIDQIYYFDLTGNLVKETTKGRMIKVTLYKNGTKRVDKVMF